MLHVTIWMNMPSFHQSDLFAALAASGHVDLQVLFARPLTPERLNIGWQDDHQGYDHRFLNERAPILDALELAWSQRDRLHVINGIWAEPAFAAALCALMAGHATYAIYSEAPSPYRPRSPWKKMLQTLFGKLAVRHSTGLLPVARFAEEFYLGLGARSDHLYPFGYFRNAPLGRPTRRDALPLREPKDEAGCELIFVGQLIERKGVDILLQALASLLGDYPRLQLAIVGDGRERESLQGASIRLGIANRVQFEGVIPADQIPARISQTNLLVLPSRWDGWGMVVNEALMTGVPVLVSDHCGAAEVVRDGCNGYIFHSGDPTDLQKKLREFLSRREAWPLLRCEAASMGKRILAEQASIYLIHCLEHMQGMSGAHPRPPWSG
jgi:glycosyltransferase involved in cell wall biosynthesis